MAFTILRWNENKNIYVDLNRPQNYKILYDFDYSDQILFKPNTTFFFVRVLLVLFLFLKIHLRS